MTDNNKYYDARKVELTCVQCEQPILFSLLEISNNQLVCQCGKSYLFSEELIDKMTRFEKLLNAIFDAKDMLGSANVGIMVNGSEIKIPYILLLTRMNTLLKLNIGGKETVFKFRIEPSSIVEKK